MRADGVRTSTLRASEVTGDRAERAAEVSPDRLHDGDRSNRNQRRDQAVLDRRNAAFVLDQTGNQGQHLSFPLEELVAMVSSIRVS